MPFHALRSFSMAQGKPERRQKTRPKKGKPVEIPVPKRSEFDRLMDKAVRKEKPQR
jgi:hypothetical protein